MTPTQPTAEHLEVTQADRDLWKYLLDAPKSQCTMMDTCNPATAELQAIARHRQATEARMAAAVEEERERLLDVVNLWKDSQHAQLKMGEMTAHELRLLRAFVTAISASLETAIRSQSNG